MTVILTGGGTAGHVSPNAALLPALREKGFDIRYIGGRNGIEKEIIEPLGVAYYGISAGKFRRSGKIKRFADTRNIADLFRVVKGLGEAVSLVKQIKPNIVFSKGGYVAVPVVMAAFLRGVPVVAHESDMTPGLANKLSLPFAKKICVNFPETLARLPKKKAVLTGTPIREGLFRGDRFIGLELCRFERNDKPVILFTGGSQGSAILNACARAALPKLCKRYRVIHLCGKGNLADIKRGGYAQFEYAGEELPHLLALADAVVSRAGANTIFELLALGKPNLLIPLTKKTSRGDQLLNAASFEKQGFSMVLYEEDLNEYSLCAAVDSLYNNRRGYMAAMAAHSGAGAGTARVMDVIMDLL